MAAFYLVGTDVFISEADLDYDTEDLIHSEVLHEMQKRGISMEDALASLTRIVKQMERNYGSD